MTRTYVIYEKNVYQPHYCNSVGIEILLCSNMYKIILDCIVKFPIGIKLQYYSICFTERGKNVVFAGSIYGTLTSSVFFFVFLLLSFACKKCPYCIHLLWALGNLFHRARITTATIAVVVNFRSQNNNNDKKYPLLLLRLWPNQYISGLLLHFDPISWCLKRSTVYFSRLMVYITNQIF